MLLRRLKGLLPLVFLLVGVFFTSAYISFWLLSSLNLLAPKEKFKNIQEPKTDKALDSDFLEIVSYNLLLLGYGGAEHEGSYLTDVLMLVHINTSDKKISLTSIPRDLWVEIPLRSDLSEYRKINEAFAIGNDDNKYPLKESQFRGKSGGGNLAKHVVGKVLGIPVNYFVAVDFDGFRKVIDVLGGVEVEVEIPFDDYFYPVKGKENESCGKTSEEIANLTRTLSGFELEKEFKCRYEHLHFDKGKILMDGEMALRFVRSRHSETQGGDFSRSVRQQALLLAVGKKALSLGALNNISSFIRQFEGLVKYEIDEDEITSILREIDDILDYKIVPINLSEDNVLTFGKSDSGQFILFPKEGIGSWEGVQKFIKDKI
ncbi:hypothetical protein A2686_00400 [Candidatus Woesebacteria bacterium RIFCSPHIGHO2_01_FULL_38_10]|uniref:Cell envelope-related transcriptional attenuator domain-containing protein n=1 Tax=Candidatus Woesebacteria bacterium RIFCSPLOWO2_01_FULL_39_10b TaxID=1802517 RepID=A0A1F8B856_9BACT|nr:MAG: hypothetical protein A2686_00400 [Candidatus Woesebacteria bacterium RIFCSPHIGHO2_01_FULL_38_10]OGM60224.1 MAG: hypothetical protein A2892_04235 [Candidatus Woesebacteria bacterium RIFCSPLOWO2_01_FULL_39_10b]